jgi:hypothetical protein
MKKRRKMKMNKIPLPQILIAFSFVGVILMILKLLEIINWSWWIVLLPIYGPYTLSAVLLILLILIHCNTNYN